jgi:hypothetical protein
MPLPFLRLLPPLVIERSAAPATVLLPPAPPACFYSGAASAMYQSLMRKRCAGSSAMTDARPWIDTMTTSRHNTDIINDPDICHGSNNNRINDIDTVRWS